MMKTDLSHIPIARAEYLRRATQLILHEARKSQVKIAFIILFGSYARGDWVYDLTGAGRDQEGFDSKGYISDFDIMIIAEKKGKNDLTFLYKMERKFAQEWQKYKPSTTVIMHDIHQINEELQENEYFFMDIKKEGIILYDSGKCQLDSPRNFTPGERQKKAQVQYDYWMGKAQSIFRHCLLLSDLDHNDRNWHAFSLHQITESIYSAIALVYSDYKPHTHDLVKFEKYVTIYEPRFLHALPRETEHDKHLFKLLYKAYVEARYKMTYQVTATELEEIAVKVKNFQALAEELCKEKIASFSPPQ